jgi:hypothetical protein
MHLGAAVAAGVRPSYGLSKPPRQPRPAKNAPLDVITALRFESYYVLSQGCVGGLSRQNCSVQRPQHVRGGVCTRVARVTGLGRAAALGLFGPTLQLGGALAIALSLPHTGRRAQPSLRAALWRWGAISLGSPCRTRPVTVGPGRVAGAGCVALAAAPLL